MPGGKGTGYRFDRSMYVRYQERQTLFHVPARGSAGTASVGQTTRQTRPTILKRRGRYTHYMAILPGQGACKTCFIHDMYLSRPIPDTGRTNGKEMPSRRPEVTTSHTGRVSRTLSDFLHSLQQTSRTERLLWISSSSSPGVNLNSTWLLATGLASMRDLRSCNTEVVPSTATLSPKLWHRLMLITNVLNVLRASRYVLYRYLSLVLCMDRRGSAGFSGQGLLSCVPS